MVISPLVGIGIYPLVEGLDLREGSGGYWFKLAGPAGVHKPILCRVQFYVDNTEYKITQSCFSHHQSSV